MTNAIASYNADQTSQRRQHQEEVANAQKSLQSFIKCLRQLPYRDGTHMLSMDLYAVFEGCCGIDLPLGFQIEFGRQFNKACLDGRLPFRRKTVEHARLAAFVGLDPGLMYALMGVVN